ncbi:replication factor C small subunit [Sulfolobus sp. A20]|uniref:replication factor C small subunit n=2 Tax=Sulfolobaceae TaxID=118883 RepID=UPI000845CBF6|nr:replication factor C small subunit [Sulfolobus sp. A20]TRM74189.1 replication factor C small subunit [Sulfolobus sp. E5]TRM74477.1 replication factor C small subunit [Sulfolobus sp. B5]TRM78290.1 replication factor C small subunit [Sulfolobus sp. A20-N-F8]TRM81722.1 replication factor C small subunit [Sulfolobus sp. D5]TRM99674.1 replication factor C small subunit [Sulfolobus sp. E1]TRN01166.1 replication factor C small subunit [Sulfolobus sp. F1]
MSGKVEEVLWAEKYRPRSLDDIVNQKEIVERLKKFVKEKNMPHLLFAGPPGTGKTTAALALVHDLYGESYVEYFLELNASDERGIDVIRNKVKEFARTVAPTNVPFKVVLLDEADNMTADAQQALRRTMELYTESTRFILACNYLSKIIEPIQSRTALFRFYPLKREDIVSRLAYILKNEKVEYDQKALDTIYDITMGDMRKSINILQAASAYGKVTVDSVYKVLGLAQPKEIREMLNLALQGKFMQAREKLKTLLVVHGLSGEDIIKQIHRELTSSDLQISDELRVLLLDYIGEAEFRIIEGADDEIQLSATLAKIAIYGNKYLGDNK